MLQNSQKLRAGTKNAVPVPRVSWHGAYRTHRRFGYGYECLTELTDVPGTGMKVSQNFQKFRVLWRGRTELTEVPGRCKNAAHVPRVLWQGRTDLSQLSGTGVNVVQNSQKFFVRVWMLYRTHSCQKFRVRVMPTSIYAPSGEELDLKWRISSNLNMACSHWANVPKAIRSCVGIIDNHHRGNKS